MTDYTSVDLPFLCSPRRTGCSCPGSTRTTPGRWATSSSSLARVDGLAVTVAVAHGQQLMFHVALPGTVPDQADGSGARPALVYRFGHSSYFVGRSYRDRGASFEDEPHLDPTAYAAHGGAFPLRVVGVGLVGVLAVSGLPQDQDHALAVRALEAHRASPA